MPSASFIRGPHQPRITPRSSLLFLREPTLKQEKSKMEKILPPLTNFGLIIFILNKKVLKYQAV